jgi:hypothetical protein
MESLFMAYNVEMRYTASTGRPDVATLGRQRTHRCHQACRLRIGTCSVSAIATVNTIRNVTRSLHIGDSPKNLNADEQPHGELVAIES